MTRVTADLVHALKILRACRRLDEQYRKDLSVPIEDAELRERIAASQAENEQDMACFRDQVIALQAQRRMEAKA